MSVNRFDKHDHVDGREEKILIDAATPHVHMGNGDDVVGKKNFSLTRAKPK